MKQKQKKQIGKQAKDIKFPPFYRNSDVILSSTIGGTLVGSTVGLPGAIIGGIVGLAIGYSHKEKHSRAV